MEIWFLIGGILAFGFIVGVAIEIYENYQMNKWMRKRHLRELRLAMRQLEHPEFFSRTYDVGADEIRKALTYFPTGEVEVSIGEETTNEAERLIKEARDRTVD